MTSSNALSPDTALRFRLFAAYAGITRTGLAKEMKLPIIQINALFAGEDLPDDSFSSWVFSHVGFVPEQVSLTEAQGLSSAVTNWSRTHGSVLKDAYTAAGFTYDSKSIPEDFPARYTTLKSWIGARRTPREAPLVMALNYLNVDFSIFKGIEDTKEEPNRNLLAYELQALRERSGLSIREFSSRLGVDANAMQGWLAGRTYPRSGSEDARRIELLCNLNIRNVKDEEKVRMETDVAPSRLGRLLQDERRSRGLTVVTLAETSGVFSSSIEKIESNPEGHSTSSMSTLRKLADFFEIGYDEVALAAFGPLTMDTFAQRLRSTRLMRLISIGEMCEGLGIENHGAYVRYETGLKGEEPSFPAVVPGRLEMMASILGVELESLFSTDRQAFGRWLKSEVSKKRPMPLMALVAGVDTDTINDWIEGKYWPSLQQAQILSRFCGLGRAYARSLITG